MKEEYADRWPEIADFLFEKSHDQDPRHQAGRFKFEGFFEEAYIR